MYDYAPLLKLKKWKIEEVEGNLMDVPIYVVYEKKYHTQTKLNEFISSQKMNIAAGRMSTDRMAIKKAVPLDAASMMDLVTFLEDKMYYANLDIQN